MSTRPEIMRTDTGPAQGAAFSAVSLTDAAQRLGIEPLLSLDDVRLVLGCSRRQVESMKSSGKLPPPDLYIGRLPRWKPETLRRWIDAQARGRGVGR
jgi:hypothetical protein